jgi:glycosyltransferase involved in cell wall biosynthesis
MEHPAAHGLAERFGSLKHTNDHGDIHYLYLPGFKTVGMAPEQAQAVGLLALGPAEAIIETLADLGYPPTSEADVKAQARALAQFAANPETDNILRCNRCKQDAVSLHTTNGIATVNIATLAAALTAHAEQCR